MQKENTDEENNKMKKLMIYHNDKIYFRDNSTVLLMNAFINLIYVARLKYIHTINLVLNYSIIPSQLFKAVDRFNFFFFSTNSLFDNISLTIQWRAILCIFPNHLRDFTNLLWGVETPIYENPQLEIDPSYDDVKED